jgi:hypothetical protein
MTLDLGPLRAYRNELRENGREENEEIPSEIINNEIYVVRLGHHLLHD